MGKENKSLRVNTRAYIACGRVKHIQSPGSHAVMWLIGEHINAPSHQQWSNREALVSSARLYLVTIEL